jgi:hypothetical protein
VFFNNNGVGYTNSGSPNAGPTWYPHRRPLSPPEAQVPAVPVLYTKRRFWARWAPPGYAPCRGFSPAAGDRDLTHVGPGRRVGTFIRVPMDTKLLLKSDAHRRGAHPCDSTEGWTGQQGHVPSRAELTTALSHLDAQVLLSTRLWRARQPVISGLSRRSAHRPRRPAYDIRATPPSPQQHGHIRRSS